MNKKLKLRKKNRKKLQQIQMKLKIKLRKLLQKRKERIYFHMNILIQFQLRILIMRILKTHIVFIVVLDILINIMIHIQDRKPYVQSIIRSLEKTNLICLRKNQVNLSILIRIQNFCILIMTALNNNINYIFFAFNKIS